MAATVDSLLTQMTIEHKIAHLLMPEDRRYSADDWKAILDQVPLGCVFLQAPDHRRIEENIRAIGDRAQSPVLVACDMETGYLGGTLFSPAMGLGATGNPELTRARSEIVARECRNAGFHWCFNPVVDLAMNHNNPETLTRAFGDDPNAVSAHAVAQVEGLQTGGMVAATAKHFPGAGADDRDQHLCTSVNPLSVEDWWRTYGMVYEAVIAAGVYTIMVGHISFPAFQMPNGEARPLWQHGSGPLPASLSSELQVDLLRGELGFEGVVVSDAAPMVGIASRVEAEDEAVQNILTGSDVYLFADPIEDFQRLLRAHREGRLTEEMIDEKVRRILALKAHLGVEPGTTGADTDSGTAMAARIAEASVTVQKRDAAIPAVLEPGARVVTVTVTNRERKPAPELSMIDSELRSRGFEVEHWENPSHREIMERIEHVDHLFLNIAISSHTWMGSSRLIGAAAMTFWRGWWVSHPGKVTVTSFGSPYHLYEIPSLPNMILCYGEAPACQRAAVQTWLGEVGGAGSCPVRLP